MVGTTLEVMQKQSSRTRTQRAQKKRPRVVTIGGGTGSFVLLSGLKEYPVAISAIVAMADDGGSTGVLRDEMGVLPPGDVRQCLAALARATPEVRELFSYRFTNSGLEGHSMGNLFLSVLEKITGSFPKAVAVAGNILNAYGRVIPVTQGDMRLVVELNDGTLMHGEHTLDSDERVRTVGVRSVTTTHPVEAYDEACKAITNADLVIIGPGDLYGSIIPNLLVHGIPEALHDTSARIIIVANVTNKKGLTEGFTATDYLTAIEQYLLGRHADVLVHNTAAPGTSLASRYSAQEGEGAFVALGTPSKRCHVIAADLLPDAVMSETQADATYLPGQSFIRHDSAKLAAAILEHR